MKILRRFLVVAALMFWQGGFTFYAAVVVPVGEDVLGSRLEQGYVTRSVTNYMNLAGAVTLALLAWDLLATRDALLWRRLLRCLSWALMLLALVLLVWLHPRLDALLAEDGRDILDPDQFTLAHRWYLWVSTIQWGCCVVYLWLTLRSWGVEDRN